MTNIINMKKLRQDLYLVRTQAGFNKAIKDFDEDNSLSKNDPYWFTWPTKYPSVVSMCKKYHGSWYLETVCTPLNLFKDGLHKLLEELGKNEQAKN